MADKLPRILKHYLEEEKNQNTDSYEKIKQLQLYVDYIKTFDQLYVIIKYLNDDQTKIKLINIKHGIQKISLINTIDNLIMIIQTMKDENNKVKTIKLFNNLVSKNIDNFNKVINLLKYDHDKQDLKNYFSLTFDINPHNNNNNNNNNS